MNPTPVVVVTLPEGSDALASDVAAILDTVTITKVEKSSVSFTAIIPDPDAAQSVVDLLYAYFDEFYFKGTVTFHLCSHGFDEAGTVDCSTLPDFVRVVNGTVTAFGGEARVP